jgi:hypothetical protein
MAQLADQGVVFRNEHYSEAVSPDGVHFREIHLAGHDDINIVLLQVIGSDTPIPPTGFSGVGPLVCIVREPTEEKRFYEQVVGLKLSHDNILAGPDIEQMIGLPAGCALEVSIWAEPGSAPGRGRAGDLSGALMVRIFTHGLGREREALHTLIGRWTTLRHSLLI